VAETGLAVSQMVMLKRASRGVDLSWATIAVAAVAGAVAVVVGLALPVHPLIGVLVASVVYFAILKLLGRFPPEVREILFGAGRIGSAVG